MSNSPLVTIGLPVYNSERYLGQSLDSLLAQTYRDFRLIINDNASTDGTPRILEEYAAKDPRVKPVFHDENRGFAGVNNPALKQCRGEFILLLNNDALLIDDSVLQGIEFLRQNPGNFGCGGLLLNPDWTLGISYGRFPGIRTLARELATHRFGRLRGIVPGEHEGPHAVDFPCGAYFLARADRVRQVGLMDETFFLYFEETDWARRAWRHGFPIHYLPACRAVHLGGGSSEGQTPLPVIATFYESWFLYVRKHSPIGARPLLFLLLFPYLLGRTLASLARNRRVNARLQWRHVRGLLWAACGKPSRTLAAAKRA